LNSLVGSEDFLRGLDQLSGDEEGDDTKMDDEELEEEGEEDLDDEEGEDELDEDKFEDEDKLNEGEQEEDMENFLDDQDEEEEERDQIKIPSDLEDADEEYGNEGDSEEGEVDEDDEFGQFGNDGDMENAVFSMAKENNEMRDLKSLNKKEEAALIEEGEVLSTKKIVSYVNSEMIERIEKLETQMVGGGNSGREAKAWQLTGEVASRARPLNSLLEEHLDFNTVSKLPPTITQEKSTNIEAMIKQRITDELFDDPIRKYLPGGKKGRDDDDNGFDFTKSKKGLGELYEDDYRKKLL